MPKQLPDRGDPNRNKVLYSHAAMVRAIAYTNTLHLCSGDPDQWINDNIETWNHQLNYAEMIIDSMVTSGVIATRSTT